MLLAAILVPSAVLRTRAYTLRKLNQDLQRIRVHHLENQPYGVPEDLEEHFWCRSRICMGILTDDMKRIVREQRLGYVATVCRDGTPNLSPKGTTVVWDDDHLMFADIRSPQSVQNIEHNPSVAVNVVDPLVRKGYRFKGRGFVHRSGEVFERGCQMYRNMGTTTSEIRAVVLIRVDRALPLISPAYDRGETEEQVKDRWRRYWRKLWDGVEE